MAEQQAQGTIKTRMAVLIFCRGVGNPMVLYFDNAEEVYNGLKTVLNSNETKMIEFEPIGPIKKAAMLSSDIVGVAMQEEKYLVQE